ncbi:hypothetical protein HRV97_14290 [Sphingomonas sp. HHU CXW]|uniref:DUF5666 domain-containing protein n=1 Tax=Sphingomonas hominis TaxID=2741495 RepID=A0ABX2JTF6_9SPHN|nr:hypothetical protein [Sphingomonas hominis]NTS66327.1 hypothetical protein [Sphingomonas hominis]
MVDFDRLKKSRGAMAAAAATLLVLGAAGGVGAAQASRPTITMAPTTRIPIAKLATSSGVVTVTGRVAEVYGDRLVVQDASGRAMIAVGQEGRGMAGVGQPVTVQGRFDDGQLRASYLVDRDGTVAAVGPRGPRPGGPDGGGAPRPHGPGQGGPERDGPGRDGPPPPPGCAAGPDARVAQGAVPPPPPPRDGSAVDNGAAQLPPAGDRQPLPNAQVPRAGTGGAPRG